jgi:TctA family transporter
MVCSIAYGTLIFDQVEIRAFTLCLLDDARASIMALFEIMHSFLAASITILAIVTESEIAERTRGLLLISSLDSTRASFTAATSPATTATVPCVLSGEAAADSGARKH